MPQVKRILSTWHGPTPLHPAPPAPLARGNLQAVRAGTMTAICHFIRRGVPGQHQSTLARSLIEIAGGREPLFRANRGGTREETGWVNGYKGGWYTGDRTQSQAMGARRPAIGYVERGAGVQRPGTDPRNGSCSPVSHGLIQQGPPRERDFDPGDSLRPGEASQRHSPTPGSAAGARKRPVQAQIKKEGRPVLERPSMHSVLEPQGVSERRITPLKSQRVFVPTTVP